MQEFLKSYRVVLAGVFFIFLGLLLLLVVKPADLVPKLLLGFMTEVGFALVIAWGVAFFIERGARLENDRYILEKARVISQNVFSYLYGVQFPKSAFSVLQEFVFSPPIIKTRQILDYELIDPIDNSGWTTMRCEFDYTLRNISDVPIEHPIRFYTSEVSGGKAPKLPGVGLQSLVIATESINPDDFPKFDKAAPDEVGQRKYEVVRTILPGSDLRVRVTFVQPKKIEDNDLWQSNSVCESLEFKIRYNPEVYDVFLEPVHPGRRFDTEIKQNAGDNCRTVSINRPLLPNNGVFMWWSKKAPEVPQIELQAVAVA